MTFYSITVVQHIKQAFHDWEDASFTQYRKTLPEALRILERFSNHENEESRKVESMTITPQWMPDE